MHVYAGVVDQHVQPSKSVQRNLDQRVSVLGAANVVLEKQSSRARGCHLGGEHGATGLIHVGDDDGRASGAEQSHIGLPRHLDDQLESVDAFSIREE